MTTRWERWCIVHYDCSDFYPPEGFGIGRPWFWSPLCPCRQHTYNKRWRTVRVASYDTRAQAVDVLVGAP